MCLQRKKTNCLCDYKTTTIYYSLTGQRVNESYCLKAAAMRREIDRLH